MVPRGAEEAQNGARSGPKPPQEEPKKVKKANPNGKTKKGPNQDDPKTDLDPPRGRVARYPVTPRGSFGRPNRQQNGTKNDAKTKRKIKSQKNRSKTILDPSWGDLGPSWVPSWGPGNALALRLPMFREHSLFRC